MSSIPAQLIRCLRRGDILEKQAFLKGISPQDYQDMLELASLHRVGANLYQALKPFINETWFPVPVKAELVLNQ